MLTNGGLLINFHTSPEFLSLPSTNAHETRLTRLWQFFLASWKYKQYVCTAASHSYSAAFQSWQQTLHFETPSRDTAAHSPALDMYFRKTHAFRHRRKELWPPREKRGAPVRAAMLQLEEAAPSTQMQTTYVPVFTPFLTLERRRTRTRSRKEKNKTKPMTSSWLCSVTR